MLTFSTTSSELTALAIPVMKNDSSEVVPWRYARFVSLSYVNLV